MIALNRHVHFTERKVAVMADPDRRIRDTHSTSTRQASRKTKLFGGNHKKLDNMTVISYYICNEFLSLNTK